MQNIHAQIHASAEYIEEKLTEYLRPEDGDYPGLAQAMRYSALSGGKRLRPFLTLSVCEMLGGSREAAAPYACALEMIHTYSLIHDDLPCMDNDDLRRGKPTNHKMFGESTALLAGDTLLTYAFEVCAGNPHVSDLSARRAVMALAECAGAFGMAGGQMMDLDAEGGAKPDREKLMKIHRLKTGALLRAAVQLGALAANDSPADDLMSALTCYAENIGIAFQITDDMLDVTGDEQVLGKPVGSDAKNEKITILSFLPLAEAGEEAARLTEEGCRAVAPYDKNGTLSALAQSLLQRDK